MRAREARWRRLRLAGWTAGLVAVVSVITVMLVTSRPVESGRQRVAPAFALTDTAGTVHQLADHKGKNVLLYFNEGAGCDACFYQMVEIEKRSPEFAKLGVTVLPIAANPVEAVRRDIVRFGLKTPWLLDPDVHVSTAYGTVGRGMHAGLPGHGFVLVDTQGRQRWYGEYPTMFVPADELLAEVRTRLT
ncbi:MAG: peroxiredoxin family protein [Mycobacterium leprae]